MNPSHHMPWIMQKKKDFTTFLGTFLYVNCEWMTEFLSLRPSVAFHYQGGEWVMNTVGSGNIWWARQPQKGSFKISRKQGRVKIQDWPGEFKLEGQALC